MQVDADGATDINDLAKLYDGIKKVESMSVKGFDSEKHGFAIGSRFDISFADAIFILYLFTQH